MTERRYREEEVRRIFSLASKGHLAADKSAPPVAQGLTLAEIQSIGNEVGISPELVARAAAELDERGKPGRTSLGLPIEAGRVVALPRNLTDNEWAQLVAEVRRIFRASGRVSEHGELREWSNGNLHVAVEPVGQGYRLRMGTLKGDAQGINALGVIGVLAAAAAGTALGLSGEIGDAILVSGVFGTGGLAALLSNVFRLPRWKTERDRQFEQLAARVKAMTEDSDA